MATDTRRSETAYLLREDEVDSTVMFLSLVFFACFLYVSEQICVELCAQCHCARRRLRFRGLLTSSQAIRGVDEVSLSKADNALADGKRNDIELVDTFA